MKISDFKNKSIHVVGASGQEGRSAIRFLTKCGANITSHDFCDEKDFEKNYLNLSDYIKEDDDKKKDFDDFKKLDFKKQFKDKYLEKIDKADAIFVPQSWYRYEFNNLLKKLEGKISFYSTTDIMLNFSKATTIGITGTNGKSTTSRLIENILKQNPQLRSGQVGRVWFSGNDRELEPMADKVFDMKENDFLVLEISNRQLKLTTASPHIAVVTNITPNHLDDHENSFEKYIETKKNILNFQSKDDSAVLNYDNEHTKKFADDIKAQIYFFSKEKIQKKGAYWDKDNIVIGKASILNVKINLFGEHNKENVLAASLACYLAGVSVEDIKEGIEDFGGVKHRLELVRELNGAKYYNDSQSTSPDSLVKAIKSFDHSLILIAGGFRKNATEEDYKEVIKLLEQNNVKKVFLIGETGKMIANVLDKNKVDSQYFETLDEAVENAYNISEAGDAIVMSPGAESFGLFKDYREKGESFKNLIKELE